jgi:hypothetical protein
MKWLKRIQTYWTKDRAMLMLCISIAFIFWFLNKLSTTFRKTIPIKLEYSLPSGKVFSEPPPIYLQATMRGRGWDLLTRNEEKVFINLNRDSVQTFPMRNIVSQHLASEVVGINMEQWTYHIENAVTKPLPLEAIYDLEFDKGFDLADKIELNPATAIVTGPISFFDNNKSIKTDTIRMKGLRGNKKTSIRLQEYPLLRLNIEETEANIKSEQFTEKSMFIPIVVQNAPLHLKYFPNKIKVDCTVPLSKYAQLTDSYFTAVADLKDEAQNSKKNSVPIIIVKQPDYVRNVKFSPKSVVFYLEK